MPSRTVGDEDRPPQGGRVTAASLLNRLIRIVAERPSAPLERISGLLRDVQIDLNELEALHLAEKGLLVEERDRLQEVEKHVRCALPALDSFLDYAAPSDNEVGISSWAIRWHSARVVVDELRQAIHNGRNLPDHTRYCQERNLGGEEG